MKPIVSRAGVPLAFVLAIVGIVYFPVTRVYFHDDDFVHLFVMANRGFSYFLWESTGGHMEMTRNAVFYLMFTLFGIHSEPYQWLSFVTHVLAVIFFFRAARGFTGSLPLAAFGAALWGTCPVLCGALGWQSAYGQVMSGAILLFVLDRVANRAGSGTIVPNHEAYLWALLLLVGATCFGVGIGMAVAAPAVVALLLPGCMGQRSFRTAFVSLPIVVIGLYWVYAASANNWDVIPAWLPSAATRHGTEANFGLKPVFATVLSLAAHNFGVVLSMSWRLAAFGVTSLLGGGALAPDAASHDVADVVVPGLYCVIVLGAAIAADDLNRSKIIALSILVVAIYGIVALGRANLYVALGVQPAQSAKEGRYHYAGTIPLAMLLPLALREVTRRFRFPRPLSIAAVATWGATAAWLSWRITSAIPEYEEGRESVAMALEGLNQTIDSRPRGSDVYIVNHLVAGATVLGGPREFPGLAALFVIAHGENRVRGRRVRFIETPEIQRLYPRPLDGRLADLLVIHGPSDAPAPER